MSAARPVPHDVGVTGAGPGASLASGSDLTRTRTGPVAALLLGLIRAYQWTAQLRQPRCRFHPTCSAYAAEAVRRHGALRGGWLAIRRIGRCHPWNPGGVDHVPEDLDS